MQLHFHLDWYWNAHKGMSSPNAIAQAGNLFVFTMNNPVRWIDPTGLFAEPIGSYLPMPGDVYIRWTPRETSSWTYSWKNPNRVEPGSTPAASPSTTPSVTTGTMRVLQPHGGGIIHFGPLTVGMAGNSINEILEADGGGKGGIIRINHGERIAAERARTGTPRPVFSGGTAKQPPNLDNVRGVNPPAQASQGIAINNNVSITTSNKLPTTGTANSTIIRVDANGKPITIRHFGPDGRAVRDIHHGHTHHHSNIPKGQAHWHGWDWGNPSAPTPTQPGMPLSNYLY